MRSKLVKQRNGSSGSTPSSPPCTTRAAKGRATWHCLRLPMGPRKMAARMRFLLLSSYCIKRYQSICNVDAASVELSHIQIKKL